MELNFIQTSELFAECEFEATSDFNLHIERNKGGQIFLYQRTAGNGWAAVDDFNALKWQMTIDIDFVGSIYPKSIKVVSEAMPTLAVVTFKA